MKVDFQIGNQTCRVDLAHPIDISIPVRFQGEQPNAYGVPRARARAYEDGNFVGDTRRGGSCNFEEYTIIPHCNGTHTECVGHISYERISVHTVLRHSFLPATLISVVPAKASDADDSYAPDKESGDLMITQESLRTALKDSPVAFLHGLIVRTLPNSATKMSRNYLDHPPPFFSLQAMQTICDLGVQHLLVDLPSVDRAFDQGKLSCHHIFWNVAQDSHEVDQRNHSLKTITEMIYVPDEIVDGPYLLNLQIPNFVADAAPSRVLIYKTEFE